jgi:hypothetical protein
MLGSAAAGRAASGAAAAAAAAAAPFCVRCMLGRLRPPARPVRPATLWVWHLRRWLCVRLVVGGGVGRVWVRVDGAWCG